MTKTEKKALAAEARRDMRAGDHDLKPEEWVTLLNCYKDQIKAAECAAILKRDPRTVRSIYLNLSLVSLDAVLQDIHRTCAEASA